MQGWGGDWGGEMMVVVGGRDRETFHHYVAAGLRLRSPPARRSKGIATGVCTAFQTKDNSRFHCLKSGPLMGPAWLGTALRNGIYPTLAREFQGFRVWGKFVFRTLELTDTPTNLANQVKVGHALDQSHSVQSCGPGRAHQNNEPSRRSSRSDHPTFETVLRRLIGCIYFLSVG